MKRSIVYLLLVTMVLWQSAGGAEAPLVTIEGAIVNHKGRVFADVTVHAIGEVNGSRAQFQVRSDAAGKFRFEVPPGNWLIRVDPDELIIRGYACFPDYSQPVFADVQLETFQVIPTRPIFTTPRKADGKVQHTVTFDTTTAGPIQTIRTYNVQWSVDQKEWKTFDSISLVTSPLEITDSEAGSSMKFYRCILVENE